MSFSQSSFPIKKVTIDVTKMYVVFAVLGDTANSLEFAAGSIQTLATAVKPRSVQEFQVPGAHLQRDTPVVIHANATKVFWYYTKGTGSVTPMYTYESNGDISGFQVDYGLVVELWNAKRDITTYKNKLKDAEDLLEQARKDLAQAEEDFRKAMTAQPPIITLKGDATVSIDLGSGEYTDPGASACYGNISDLIVLSGDFVDTKKPGVYTLRYNLTLDDGQKADEVIRTVTVKKKYTE